MTEIKAFLELVRAFFGPQIMTVLALSAVQVVLAVAVALKTGTFDLKKLGDFFKTIILPKLLGWLACSILAQFALPEYLPAELGPGIALAAFLAVVASFAGAILQNLTDLNILPAQVMPILNKLGISKNGFPF